MARFGVIVLQNNRSIRSYDIRNGDTIRLCLSLIPEWSLSVIYPVVAIEDHGQRLEWNVCTHQDGSLTEHNSGLDVSYLFWEAKANLGAFPLSPTSKLQPVPVDTFDPISSNLNDMDSVVIPVGKVAVYLDKSLKALGLHTEARTSFITCLLATIIPEARIHRPPIRPAYERAASLSITPQPDVMTHMQAERDIGWWVDEIGVDPVRAGDVTLFRVLEWGGTEVFD
ncbi:hypothetical protein EDD22DRAFT_973700 [Suillus occidentalis]|nr:hypothetical protein EDD22DRAFT_973700 [Suillus occidentalis]